MNNDLIRTIPRIDSIHEISVNYDAWLVDLWGVLHNGEFAHEAAVHACERYRDEGGIVVLISNAPRPAEAVRDQIEGYGVPSSVDDGIISSGDVTRFMLAASAGNRFYTIGPDRDLGIFDGIDAVQTDPEDADAILLTGLFDDSTETPADYRARMLALSERDLPMICANPDIKVQRGDQVIYAAGAIAAVYEEMGGKVIYAGKPHRPIYDLALTKINEIAGREIPKERILAIGDGILTDIKGASSSGIDSLFIPSAVHIDAEANEMAEAVAELFADKDFRPIAFQNGLQW